MIKTQIQIINLESAKERRFQMENQLLGQSLCYRFFKACTGLQEPIIYHEQTAFRKFGRKLTPSELGCYSSHYKVWELLAHSEYDQFFVFEDDVIVDWAIIEKLSKFNFAKFSFHLVRFTALFPLPLRVVHFNFADRYNHLTLTTARHLGIAGYCVTKLGAKTLLKNCVEAFQPVDWAMHRYWKTGLPTYILFPFPLTLRTVASTIDHELSRDAGFSKNKMVFLWNILFKIQERLSREVFNLKRLFLPPHKQNSVHDKVFIEKSS